MLIFLASGTTETEDVTHTRPVLDRLDAVFPWILLSTHDGNTLTAVPCVIFPTIGNYRFSSLHPTQHSCRHDFLSFTSAQRSRLNQVFVRSARWKTIYFYRFHFLAGR